MGYLLLIFIALTDPVSERLTRVRKHRLRLSRSFLGSCTKRYWEIIADNLSKAGWSWGCGSEIDSNERTIWIADAHRGDGKRFAVHADEKLTAFLELETAIQPRCCEYRLLANNHNVEAAPHHRKIEVIVELHGH
jgi:hypothetical protein